MQHKWANIYLFLAWGGTSWNLLILPIQNDWGGLAYLPISWTTAPRIFEMGVCLHRLDLKFLELLFVLIQLQYNPESKIGKVQASNDVTSAPPID